MDFRPFPKLLALCGGACLLAASAWADDVAPTVTNPLYPNPPNVGLPTAGQFSSFAPVSSTAVVRPESGNLRLSISFLGGSFAGSVPEFAIGDVIGTPLLTFTDAQNRVVPLRREPLRKSEASFKYRKPGDPSVRVFNPATAILGERYFWSEHARMATVPDATGLYERPVTPGESGTIHDGFIYANQGGGTVIYWRTTAPIGLDTNSDAIYGLVDRPTNVSTASRLPVRRIFWTQHGFQGQPVQVPQGEIQQVRIAFSDSFPEEVADGSRYVPPGAGSGSQVITRRTLFYDNGALNAYNREGRVIVELLAELRTSTGLRRQVGIEVVDVIQEPVPGLVEVPLGERLYPLPIEEIDEQSYPLPAAGSERQAALARIETNLALYNPSLVLNTVVVAQPFTMQFEIGGQLAYFATRVTNSASDVQVFWREPGLAQIQWPKFLNRYRQTWPDELADYAMNVRPSDAALVPSTVPIFGDNAAFELVYQDDPANAQARLGEGVAFEVGLDSGDPTNRSLILFRTGNDFWFVRVESVLDTHLNAPTTNGRYAGYYENTSDAGTDVYDFNTDLGGAALQGSAVRIGNAVRLTDAVGGVAGTVVFANPGAGSPVRQTGFTVDFSLVLGPTTTAPGDGVSFAVGDMGSGYWGDLGPGTARHINVRFDTYNEGGPNATGVRLSVNGTQLAYNPTNPYTNGAPVPVQVTFDEITGLSVTFNGTRLFSNVAVPGFTLLSTDRFGFGAQTGAANEVCTVDDVEITIHTPLTAFVGARLTPPPGAATHAGFVDLTKGDAIDPTAYINPFTSSITAAEAGAIIPVNAAPTKAGVTNNKLGVWWFSKIEPPARLAGRIAPLYWPSYYRSYHLEWPVNAEQIVLASNAGSGDLDPDAASGSIYFENDPAKTGYNPNEEHAQMIAGRAYALRDDLNNVNTTSDDYVLVRYTKAADQRPAMDVFRVLRENEQHTFDYNAKAGTMLQAPMPLAVMPPPLMADGRSRNSEVTPANIDPPPFASLPANLGYYGSFTFEDRKGLKWVYRGQHDPASAAPALGMKFYYPTQPGFAYPNATTGVNQAPVVGTITPFLRPPDGSGGFLGSAETGESITVSFRPYWPDVGPASGLKAEYYLNRFLNGTPATTRVDRQVRADSNSLPAGFNGTDFSVRWTGFIVIPTTGPYTFYTVSDDGSRLWINDVTGPPAADIWSDHPPVEAATGTYSFTAGQRVAVKLEYYQGQGGYLVDFRWQGPGISYASVPSSALVSGEATIEEVPSLQFAETLVDSKYGLPSLRGASSASVLYQQSVARTNVKSALLHDSTRRKVTLLSPSGLPRVPTSIATSSKNGRTYFQRLPAHLQERVYLDPSLGTGNPRLGGLVLEGQFKDEIVGEDYLLPNILSAPDRAALKGLVASNDTLRAQWEAAIDALSTTVETFIENAAVPGTYIPNTTPGVSKTFTQAELAEITADDQAVDSYALTSVGGARGYVTLLLGNGRAFTDESEPVQMVILKVGPTDLYRGQVKPIVSLNPLSEQMTLQHTGDFGGRSQDFEFQWRYSPPVNGQPPTNLPDQAGASWFAKPGDLPLITIGGDQPLLTLTDNYFVMRYRPKVGHVLRPTADTWNDTQGWSAWTAPALAEGWIKRVLAGINPFNQRLSDFFNNAVNTDVSLITQAGTRWEGDIPLTLDSVQDAGLIEIYETVLRRGMNISIDGTPAVDYGPANDALLLAAGYLNDLYMALGNEAYADAANPLISLDVDPQRLLTAQSLPASLGTTIQTTATARFAFQGQVASLLDEELTLLRGRDDFLVPGVQLAPAYNRFYWNFTRGIDAGEVIYALNYNITEKAGADADGKIDSTDAARQYPQGHGDAYGHYLTALKNYYRLLSDPEFTWTPRVEAVNILGVPVTVDYRDERKLAAAAVALGRTGSRIIDLERRKLPIGTDSGWAVLRESRVNASSGVTRAWGVEQWAARAGQGNYLHWIVANSLLPENDVANQGLQKIDRKNVPELDELATLGAEIQTHMDGANRHANALNLSDDSILFDLSPSELASGQSHFDQVLTKAKAALANAATAHARTIEQNALLRSVENQAADYNFTVSEQETAFTNRLREIYGQPYAGDIGPGKTYPQGYTGPDLLRFMFIDRPYVYEAKHLFGTAPRNHTFTLPIKQSTFSAAISTFNSTTGAVTALQESFRNIQNSTDPTINLSYTFDLNAGPYQIAPSSHGARGATGQVQNALTRVMNAREQLFLALRSASGTSANFQSELNTFREDLDARIKIRGLNSAFAAAKLLTEKIVGALVLKSEVITKTAEANEDLAFATIEAAPRVIGLSNDTTSALRAAILATKVAANKTLTVADYATKIATYVSNTAINIAELAKNEAVTEIGAQGSNRADIAKLTSAYSAVTSGMSGLDAAIKELTAATNAYENIVVEGLRVQDERETFRKRAATAVQGARVRDVAFRAFRTESLEQYKQLYDQAARYTFLAAKAYDYETTQLGTDAGRSFLSSIVSTRALGLVGTDGEPQIAGASTGDAGLSSALAKLQSDWSVAKGRLGINNPDTYGTLFSLRRELFNLPYLEDGSAEDHTAWQDMLRAALVTDLRSDPAIAAHALPTSNPTGLAQPGFVIDFPTTIETGQNFFGKPLGAGDSAYSSASFSTKINSVGVVFTGYLGMNPYSSGNTGIPSAPTHNSPDALAATPYVYLIPGGADTMRTPPLGGAPTTIREWNVLDHAMPLPYDIGGGGFGQNTQWTSATSLTEPFFLPRKHQPFRATDNAGLFFVPGLQDYTNRRLIGRSVWNSNWKLVIPAQTLLANPQEGIERFIRSVKDIKLYLKTYSHAGN